MTRLASIAKYHNRKAIVDGIAFDSAKEARRYSELKLLERAGEIVNLRVHVRYPLVVGGVKVCDYVCDFAYEEFVTGGRLKTAIEDVKSTPTRRLAAYRIKKKLMLAIWGIEIRET